jgi:stage III sporulation protein AG
MGETRKAEGTFVKGFASWLRSGRLQPMLALAAAAVGLLLLFSGRSGGTEEPDPVGTELAGQAERYARSLEKQVEELCGQVGGVGDVTAVVTLEGSFEYVYARDTQLSTDGEAVKGSYEYVVVGSGAGEKAVCLTQRLPAVAGIGVVCSGGGSPAVQAKLIELLSAAFGVASHRISVTD